MSDKYDDLSPVIDDYVAPVRADIRKALMDVSNFTLKEISVLGWSALYKAHSLIVKYGQTDVEEDFREKDWFQQAVAEVDEEKLKDFDLSTGFKLTEEDLKKIEEDKAKKERFKELKKDFKKSDFKVTDLTGLLNDMLDKPSSYSVKVIDESFVDIIKEGNTCASFMIYKNSLYFKKK